MPIYKRFRSYKRASRGSQSYKLTEQIAERQTWGMCGVYWIIATLDGIEVVAYVGRSKSNIADRLVKSMDRYSDYTHFRFRQCANELTAFRAECEEFHRYGGSDGLDNVNHPPRPGGHRGHGVMCSVKNCPLNQRYR